MYFNDEYFFQIGTQYTSEVQKSIMSLDRLETL